MTDDVDASLNFGNDGKRECIFYLSFLSGSIRNPNNGRGHALSFPIEGQKEKEKEKHGCLIKDFRQREKYYKAALPPYKPQKRRKHKRKR